MPQLLVKLLLFTGIISRYYSREMLIIVDYQKDFLLNGRLGPNPRPESFNNIKEHKAKMKELSIIQAKATHNIIKLIWEFHSDLILFSKDMHPPGHISFLSTHITKNSLDKEILSFLRDSSKPGEIKKVQIIYDAESSKNNLESKNEYNILKLNYLNKEEVKEGEIELMQELWPDHCVNYPDQFFNGISNKEYRGVNLDETVKITLDLIKETNSEVYEIHKGSHTNMDAYSIVKNNIGNIYSKVPDYIRDNEVKKIFIVGVATDFCVLFSAKDISMLFPDVEVYIVTDATLAITNQKEVLEGIRSEDNGIQLISTQEIVKLRRELAKEENLQISNYELDV